MNLKGYILGLLINFQFFSIVPIPLTINTDRTIIRRAVMTFPIFGLILGAVNGVIFSLLNECTLLSSLALSFIIWVIPIVLTGGIHLDGWMDTSDAYFSYQDKEKRLEIMKDPRAGAFAVLSLLILLAARFLFIYESILHNIYAAAFIVGLIPFFSRTLMGILMVLSVTAKEEGMAFYFKKHTEPRLLLFYLLPMSIAACGVLMFLPDILFLYLMFTVLILLAAIWIKQKTVQQFGGMTGDTLGASVEGIEVILWMAVWLLAYTGML
ncbi:adenosylcobinamide-GDP ribazoletransferase [Bacillus sp. SG-1]|uniref:adenosylcobinamide-GDP ribazoletransferase n=1 Tax=Bacillus sp. SG-1 TaxID=161544 RepID=UPI0005C78634|nr:adenosylcobinamide-GDP ribazoletransferase [Bacillus sp. SG-1]